MKPAPPASIGYVNLPVFGGVVAASLLFAPLGATLAHKLPDMLLRRLFAVFRFGPWPALKSQWPDNHDLRLTPTRMKRDDLP